MHRDFQPFPRVKVSTISWAPRKRGATLIFAAVLMTALLAMVAFAIDVGYMVLIRTQLQAAADSAAMAAAANMGRERAESIAAAREYAEYHNAGGQSVQLLDTDVEFGVWDAATRTFLPTEQLGNAVRVTCRRDAAHGGAAPTYFGRILGRSEFDAGASAVAMANPRDICFVVDLSGSMNDDTEPAWATAAINSEFGSQGHPNVGSKLMEDLFVDFGYGQFPGVLQYVGAPLGVKADQWAYSEMTKNNGPLAQASIPSRYRIGSSDTEATRKRKAYSWIIDHQIASVMPSAKPAADSGANYDYWARYLDYLMIPVTIVPPSPPSSGGGSGGGSAGGGSGGGGGGSTAPPAPRPPTIGAAPPSLDEQYARLVGAAISSETPAYAGSWTAASWAPLFLAWQGTPQANRGTLPPSQSGDRITSFNNPNKAAFPKAGAASGWRNQIGYRTYVQFMMDYGRDLTPVSGVYTPLSINSPFCPWHTEQTAGGPFRFPPREQPMHAARRSLIAAMEVVRQRNSSVPDANNRDWVSIVTFDRLGSGSPAVHQELTSDYVEAMTACTRLQSVGDKGASTATESGLRLARDLIKGRNQGGQGRINSNKVVVLLTDGIPNVYESSTTAINDYLTESGDADFYGGGYHWLDAPLMQTSQMRANKWHVYPIGIGLGTDYDFMDRAARMGGTAGENGESPRGSGNPAEYEQRLTQIFEEIITNPQVRLVQ